MKEIELNESVKIIVPAIDPWFGTGLFLTKNSTYQFEVRPSNQTWSDGKCLGKFTAEGKVLPFLLLLYPFIRMPLVKWFALLGCINKKRCSYFKIGVYLSVYSPPEDGELFCFANDALGFYKHNNKGQMELYITKIKED